MSLSPQQFEVAVRSYDPRLRVRWGNTIGRWVVERIGRLGDAQLRLISLAARRLGAKIADPDPEIAYKAKVAVERSISAKHGRHVILYAMYLDNRVFDRLFYSDLQKQGGFNAFVNKMEDYYAERDKRSAKQQKDAFDDMSKETVSLVRWLATKKSAVHDEDATREVRRALGKDKPPKGKLVDQYGTPVRATA